MKRSLLVSRWALVLISLSFCTYSAAQESVEGERRPGVQVDPCAMTTTRSYAGYIKPGWANGVAQGKFLVAADPQYPRVTRPDGTEGEDMDASTAKLKNIFTIIAALRNSPAYVPVIINGDVTEFGHGMERRNLQNLLPLMHGGVGGPLFFPGLGNHDYENNVNDCANNGCARDSVCDLVKWTQDFHSSALAPSFMDYKYSEDLMRGSLSYSVTIGRLHFIQLNNYIAYRTTFKSKVDGLHGEATYRIDPSIRWLEGDLREARKAGLIIFMNMHKRIDWSSGEYDTKIKQLVEDYGVSAIFAGHFHQEQGYYINSRFGSVPIFQSGALFDQRLLQVDYNTDTLTANVHGFSLAGYRLIRSIPLKAGTSLPPVTTDFSDAEITFYEGNSAREKAVCDIMLASYPKFNMNGTYGCSNDEARSLVIHKAKKGTLINLYGNWDQNGDQGYAVIEVTDDILMPTLVGTFDANYTGGRWKITRYGPEGLDGKISSVAVENGENFNNGYMTLWEGNNASENVVCTESVAYNRDFNLGGKCANDEARSVVFHRVKPGTNVCFHGNWDQKENQGYTCFQILRNYPVLQFNTFDQSASRPGEYVIYHYGERIDGKISSIRVKHVPLHDVDHLPVDDDPGSLPPGK